MSYSGIIPGLGFANPASLVNCTVTTCAIDTSFYNYRIDLAANIAFLVFYAVFLAIQTGIWIYYRRSHFFAAAMTLGILQELLGYAARIWSYYKQWNETAFLMQTICLAMAPAFISAAIYFCLAEVIIVFGKENSLLKPRWYARIFIPCDAIALILQGVGGAMAAAALTDYSLALFNPGRYILTAGLAWQVFTLLCFLVICGDLALRIRRRQRQLGDSAGPSQDSRLVGLRKSPLFRGMLFALHLATILIFWRCVYRLVELNDGFTGPVTYKQGLFTGFEGVLIVVAVAALVIMHPAICMGAGVQK